MKQIYWNRKIPWLLGIMFLMLTSCAHVRLISDYDAVTDNVVNALQEKVSRFFIEVYSDLETGHADYDHFKEFYQDAKVDLITLKIRADAFDKNTIVQQQIDGSPATARWCAFPRPVRVNRSTSVAKPG